jgi:serine palmitoyltransferase
LTRDQEIDDLVEDWTPEPLVAKTTPFEDADLEKRAVIVGYVYLPLYSLQEF